MVSIGKNTFWLVVILFFLFDFVPVRPKGFIVSRVFL